MNAQTEIRPPMSLNDLHQEVYRRKWQQLRKVEIATEEAKKAAEAVKKWGVNTKHIAKPKMEKPSELQRDILGLLKLRADVGTGRIAQILGLNKDRVYEACLRLTARGALSSPPPRGGHPRLWTITQAGLDALEQNRLPPIQSVVTECL